MGEVRSRNGGTCTRSHSNPGARLAPEPCLFIQGLLIFPWCLSMEEGAEATKIELDFNRWQKAEWKKDSVEGVGGRGQLKG